MRITQPMERFRKLKASHPDWQFSGYPVRANLQFALMQCWAFVAQKSDCRIVVVCIMWEIAFDEMERQVEEYENGPV